ncbi:uncharacterized protein Reph isoform X2 [Anabrus simplex]
MESEADRSSGSTTVSPYSGPITACSPYFLDSALPSDSDHNYDHHSSEEELEVINSPSNCAAAASAAAAAASAAVPKMTAACSSVTAVLPEKRKWSAVEAVVQVGSAAVLIADGHHSSGASSSDEEVQGLLAAMNTPVQFRSSPPLDAHKPGRSLSPPPKLFHYGGAGIAGGHPAEASPRKRHRHTPRPHHIQRPCLDFEKMQQLKARAVTAWRHSGDHGGHGGELSVFCW